MYNSSANYSKIWEVTLSESISSIKLNSLWAFIATNTSLFQLYIGNGTQVCNITHETLNPRINMGEILGSTWLTLWDVGCTQMQAYTVGSGAVSNVANSTIVSVPVGNINNSSNTSNTSNTSDTSNTSNSSNSSNTSNSSGLNSTNILNSSYINTTSNLTANTNSSNTINISTSINTTNTINNSVLNSTNSTNNTLP